MPPTSQGAKFAWESAGSGLEVCPEDIYGTQEIHVNGAVALAFQLYYHATQVRGCHAHQVGPPIQRGRAPLPPTMTCYRGRAFTSGHSERGALARNAVTRENRSLVAWPSSQLLLSPRTCSSSARLAAGMWSGLWLSFGAAAWSGALRRERTT